METTGRLHEATKTAVHLIRTGYLRPENPRNNPTSRSRDHPDANIQSTAVTEPARPPAPARWIQDMAGSLVERTVPKNFDRVELRLPCFILEQRKLRDNRVELTVDLKVSGGAGGPLWSRYLCDCGLSCLWL